MALQFLLDTNICIYIAKHRPAIVGTRFAALPSGSVGMSLITYGELIFGAEKSNRREETLMTLTRLAEYIPVIELDSTVGPMYGQVRAQLERQGTPIGNNDLWIAAHALALDLTLVSNNTREFSRVPNLKVENWTQET